MLHNTNDFLITENCLINIKDIKPGQKLINHENTQIQVIDVKQFSGNAFEIELNNGQKAYCKEDDKLNLVS